MADLDLTADTSEIELPLAQLAQLSPERLKLFFNLIDAGVQLIRIDLESDTAEGANKMRVRFQPSDLFLDFLSASWAGDGQVNIIE